MDISADLIELGRTVSDRCRPRDLAEEGQAYGGHLRRSEEHP